jgi:hypothetical protein
MLTLSGTLLIRRGKFFSSTYREAEFWGSQEPLQNNGGPTQTQALLSGSPAIDAGNPNSGVQIPSRARAVCMPLALRSIRALFVRLRLIYSHF